MFGYVLGRSDHVVTRCVSVPVYDVLHVITLSNLAHIAIQSVFSPHVSEFFCCSLFFPGVDADDSLVNSFVWLVSVMALCIFC